MSNDLLHPVRDWYLIKRFEDDKITEGGIELPDASIKKHPFGRVLARGPGKPCDFAFVEHTDGTGHFPLLPMSADQGDVVFFDQHAAKELELEGLGKVYVVNEINIIGLVEQDTPEKIKALKESGLI